MSREVIYKDNILAMTSFGGKGRWAPHIRVNKVKRTPRHCLNMTIRKLDLFTKVTTRWFKYVIGDVSKKTTSN